MTTKRILAILCCLAFCLTSVALAESAAPVYEPEYHTLSLDTGINMRYALLGDPEDAPIILLHGATDSYLSYSQVAPLLVAAGYSVYVPELRGHGGTDKPEEGPYTIAQHAADIDAWIQALGVKGFVLVGHSLGSLIAQTIAAESGEAYEIERVVLIASAASTVDSPTLTYMLHGDDEFPGVGVFAEGVPDEFVAEWVETNNADEEFKIRTYDHARALPSYVWINTFFGLENVDHTAMLGQITCPVFIIWGTEDVFFTAEDQEALQSALSASTEVNFYPFTGASHNTHWDEGLTAPVADVILGRG